MPKRKLSNVTLCKDGRYIARKVFGLKLDGSPNRKAFYGDNATGALNKLHEYEKQVESGLNVDAAVMTVKQWFETWMKEYKLGQLRPGTFDNYDTYIKTRIIPALGKYKLCKLRPEHLQSLINNMQKEGSRNDKKVGNCSYGTIKKTHTILSSALSQAYKNGLIVRNPISAVIMPKTDNIKVEAFTLDEQKKLLEAAEGHRLKALFVVALGTGLRLGELLALKWADEDFEERQINTSRSLSRSIDRDEDGNILANAEKEESKSSLKVGPVKTAAGFRAVPMTDEVYEALKEHKKMHLSERLKAGDGWQFNEKQKIMDVGREWEDLDLVFSTPLGEYIEPRNAVRLFESLRDKVNISKLTFHSLRHSFATNAIIAGIDYYYLSHIMGHSSIMVTLDTYASFMPDKSRSEMEKLNGMLSQKCV